MNTLVGIFPEYVGLFTAAEPVANDVAAKLPGYSPPKTRRCGMRPPRTGPGGRS